MKQFRKFRYFLFIPVVALVSLLISANHSKSTQRRKINLLNRTEWVEQQMKKMSLREKIGQFFMVAAYPNKGESHLTEIDSFVTNNHIGGIIFFQGDSSNLTTAIRRFQSKSNLPLLIGLDAEWGVQMRLFGEDRFPYNYTIGAADDTVLTRKIAEMIAIECRQLGIHINFSPVVDVNSNPNNPVIGFRSFGENPKDVSDHVMASVKGLERQGVLSCLKHFPGHGDTDQDSHYDLPVVSNTYNQIKAIDFFPFESGIRAGAGSVMIGHLNVPALDNSGTPSSLSSKIIQEYLKKELNFKGLVISDALNMKAVSDKYGKTEVVVKAFKAGCDILLFPESVEDAIVAIENEVLNKNINQADLDNRLRKLLLAKYDYIVKQRSFPSYTDGETNLAKNLVYEKAITVLKNDEVLPIDRFDQKIIHVSIGPRPYELNESMDLTAKVKHLHYYTVEEALRRSKEYLKDADLLITTIHSNTVRRKNNYGFSAEIDQWIKSVPQEKKHILTVFGNPLILKELNLNGVDAIIAAYENNKRSQNRTAQFIMGALPSVGKLPQTINDEFKRGDGINIEWGGRLKESQPEELGINPDKLTEIDRIVENGIKQKAFPGCQIVVAIDGKVIVRKSYGYHTYDNKQSVVNDDLYDIASVTKIAASTIAVMRLNSQNKFSLEHRLEQYLPELTNGTPYAKVKIQDMMTHQAGFTPWIPFYKNTLKENKPNRSIYYTNKDNEHTYQVADDLWVSSNVIDGIYKSILETPLEKKGSYKYSDLGYYFLKKIIEKQSGKSLDSYLQTEIYGPMGLRNICYNPRKCFSINKIAPTENDHAFRMQQIHGFVHDQGAAMMGGVAGHAGIFSNAGDLAALMQMLLNNGQYGGQQYITKEIVQQYTRCQFCPSNRRGAGFDKPVQSLHGGPTCSLVSLDSYGHTGFTGTMVWADPIHKVNFVFLSNRVYPDAENWKIANMNIRTEIQRVIYEALLKV